jgi:hypothetical protein
MRKAHIPLIAVLAGILAAIGTATANANGMFSGHPHLPYWFWGAAIVLILFGTAFKLTDEDQKKPNIIPIRFGYLTNAPHKISGQWVKPTGHAFSVQEVLAGRQYIDQGLVFRNDGEPAYRISIPSASQVGPSKLLFPGKVIRLEKSQGEAVLTGVIQRDPHSSIFNGLFDEMRHHNVDQLTVTVEYRGENDKIWWATVCEIERNPNVEGGLEIPRFRQKRLRSRRFRRNPPS